MAIVALARVEAVSLLVVVGVAAEAAQVGLLVGAEEEEVEEVSFVPRLPLPRKTLD